MLLFAAEIGVGANIGISATIALLLKSRFMLLLFSVRRTGPTLNVVHCLLVVGHFHQRGFRVGLTSQDESVVEVLLLEHVVDFHGDFAVA